LKLGEGGNFSCLQTLEKSQNGIGIHPSLSSIGALEADARSVSPHSGAFSAGHARLRRRTKRRGTCKPLKSLEMELE
jgi:hypothetical protein